MFLMFVYLYRYYIVFNVCILYSYYICIVIISLYVIIVMYLSPILEVQ